MAVDLERHRAERPSPTVTDEIDPATGQRVVDFTAMAEWLTEHPPPPPTSDDVGVRTEDGRWLTEADEIDAWIAECRAAGAAEV